MRRFNYILNDLAFDTFVIKCLYGEPTDEDIKECENQINLLHQKYQQLKEVIEEVREYIKEWQNFPHTNGTTHNELKNLLQILDKCKEA